MEVAIANAREVLDVIEQIKDQRYRIYTVNFELIAKALRQARIDLGYSRVEEVYSLELVVSHFITVLKRMNEKFSAETFRDFINKPVEEANV